MYRKISAKEIPGNIIDMISREWMLITAGDKSGYNMMTASWGGVGVLWNKNVATVYIRKSRFTKEFIDDGDEFSLCVLGEDYRKELGYCGSKSGRNEDKVAATGLTVLHNAGDLKADGAQGGKSNGTPYFAESRLVFICKKLYAQDMTAESFTQAGKDFPQKFYGDNDWHTMYIAEITKVLAK